MSRTALTIKLRMQSLNFMFYLPRSQEETNGWQQLKGRKMESGEADCRQWKKTSWTHGRDTSQT